MMAIAERQQAETIPSRLGGDGSWEDGLGHPAVGKGQGKVSNHPWN